MNQSNHSVKPIRRLLGVGLIGVMVGLTAVGCGNVTIIPTFDMVQVSLDSGEVSRPTVAVSALGEHVVWTWIRKDTDGWNVYASYATKDERGRSEPVRVNHIPGNANPHEQAPAQVAIAPNGDVFVVWTNSIYVPGRRFPASDLYFSRSGDGGQTWSPEYAVNSDAGGDPSGHTFHNVMVLSDNTILVSWLDSRERDRAARAATSPEAGKAAETAAATDSTEIDHSAHQMASDNTARHEIGSQVRIARSVDGGHTFIETSVADHQACPCCRTTMAQSRDGRVYLSWRHEFENGARDIVVARSDDKGLTFNDFVRVSEDNWVIDACPHAGPGLEVDANGTVLVSWFTAANSGVGLFLARSTDRGETFEPREALQPDQPVSHATFAHMAPGVLAVASEQLSAGVIEIALVGETPGKETENVTNIVTITGRTPSFHGNNGTSALAYEVRNGESKEISSVIWTRN